jgi:hypothetical protein
MTTYIYAVCDQECYNHIRTISARSLKDAQEKIIEKFRDDLELDEEFDNWHEFIDFMSNKHGIDITSTIQDIETL